MKRLWMICVFIMPILDFTNCAIPFLSLSIQTPEVHYHSTHLRHCQ